MTGSWAKGKYEKHAYYHCKNAGNKTAEKCEMYGKSIRRDNVHQAMNALLESLSPSIEMINLTRSIVADVHKQKASKFVSTKRIFERELAQIEAEQSSLLSEYVREKNVAIKNALKDEVERKQFRQEILRQQLEIVNDISIDIEEDVGTLIDFIKAPQKIWQSGTIESKKAALSLIFGTPIPYSKNEGFGTPALALPYRVLGDFRAFKDGMVEDRSA